MTMKLPVPAGRERRVGRAEADPFSTLQQEIDRLFDGFTRNFSNFAARGLVPGMDLAENDKKIERQATQSGACFAKLKRRPPDRSGREGPHDKRGDRFPDQGAHPDRANRTAGGECRVGSV
jgi:hypothetical protein